MNASGRRDHGLTLLELVLALALATSVVLGSGWWMRTAAERATKTNERLQRESATRALLDAIGRDLEGGDLSTDPEHLPKVCVKSGTLSILTRSTSSAAGAVIREYALRPATQELLATELPVEPADAHGAPPAVHVVLGGAKRFDAKLDLKARTLAVELTASDGTSKTRRWALP